MTDDGVTDELQAARTTLQRVATHVLARRRHQASGRFGLRATPGGFGTPAFGPDDALEVVRVAGVHLVHEVGGDVRSMPIDGSTLGDLAAMVGADLGVGFSAGHDTPPPGDPDDPLVLDGSAVAAVAAWFDLGWRILDEVAATAEQPATIQLWPEHFDAGTSVAVGAGAEDRCNLGASPGDGFSSEPYLYVGPWGSGRPGDEAYWNAPFGAVLTRSDLLAAPDPLTAGTNFLRRGLSLLTA